MQQEKKYYLFCYFTGNAPEEERVCFALSKDGYHFQPLNHNQPVIRQTKGTGCMRDPFIIRAQNGGYYIIATDMKSSLGWDSNHGMISWYSEDLLHWERETAIDFHTFPATASANMIWAPEALYDSEKDAYFVYYSVHNKNSEKALSIWYSYTKDFATFTPPEELFAPSSGKDAIDADIIERDGKFYMYYKDECEKTICCVVSDTLLGSYREYDGNTVACTDRPVEGNCIYRLHGTDKYIMIMDMYGDGKYFMQETEDMLHFTPVTDFDLSFQPRHGSMLAITEEEYERMVKYYES